MMVCGVHHILNFLLEISPNFYLVYILKSVRSNYFKENEKAKELKLET